MTYSECASKYIGIKTGDSVHKSIIDYYNNNIKPLPRGYKVKYSDSWCATFASVVMKMCGALNAPFECSVQRMYNKANNSGYVIKNPDINDFIVYDWDSNGWFDHIGIISGTTKTSYTVIEGNYNNGVNVRKIPHNYKHIGGFFRVPNVIYNDVTSSTSNIDKVVNDVISGKYGNGKDRKRNLENRGYNYSEIQKLVNAKLRG